MKNMVLIVVILILSLTTLAAFAANPAGATAFQRWRGLYYKAANDGDSWFACFTHPVDDVSVTYSNWHAEDGETV